MARRILSDRSRSWGRPRPRLRRLAPRRAVRSSPAIYFATRPLFRALARRVGRRPEPRIADRPETPSSPCGAADASTLVPSGIRPHPSSARRRGWTTGSRSSQARRRPRARRVQVARSPSHRRGVQGARGAAPSSRPRPATTARPSPGPASALGLRAMVYAPAGASLAKLALIDGARRRDPADRHRPRLREGRGQAFRCRGARAVLRGRRRADAVRGIRSDRRRDARPDARAARGGRRAGRQRRPDRRHRPDAQAPRARDARRRRRREGGSGDGALLRRGAGRSSAIAWRPSPTASRCASPSPRPWR